MTNEQKIAKAMRELLENRKEHVKRNKDMKRILNPFMPYIDETPMDVFMVTPEPKVEPKVEPMPLINLEMLNREQWDYLQNNHVLQTLMHEYRTFEEYHTPNTAKATKLLKALRGIIEAGGDVEASLGKFFKQDLPNFVE